MFNIEFAAGRRALGVQGATDGDADLAGHGIAMLPTYLCGPALQRRELVTLLDDYDPVSSFGRYLYACYTPSRVRLPKVRVLLDELEACFMPVPPWEKAV